MGVAILGLVSCTGQAFTLAAALVLTVLVYLYELSLLRDSDDFYRVRNVCQCLGCLLNVCRLCCWRASLLCSL